MAYLHCHSCGWEQDDFYSVREYNPAKYLLTWMEDLCTKDVDKQFTDDAQFLSEHGPISLREVIAREFEKYARRIRTMKWITYEQWQRDRDSARCPSCGARNFDID